MSQPIFCVEERNECDFERMSCDPERVICERLRQCRVKGVGWRDGGLQLGDAREHASAQPLGGSFAPTPG